MLTSPIGSWILTCLLSIIFQYGVQHSTTAGPPGIPVLKTQLKIPPPKKNFRKFPFGKMLDFARSNTISTQNSNIYLNQLQWYGQFAEVYMLLEVLSLEIYPNVTDSFPSVPHIETDRQRSITVVSTNAPPSGQTSPGHCLPLDRTPSLEHLPSPADECKTSAYDL